VPSRHNDRKKEPFSFYGKEGKTLMNGSARLRIVAFVSGWAALAASGANRSLISVDFGRLVSRADLAYSEPAWRSQDVTVHRNGKKAEDLSGEVLTFPTGRGETIVLVPKGSNPFPVKVP
jgi:hypothetical protein